MSEILFNKGYVGLAIEPAPGTATTPTDYLQAYDFNIKTKRNFNKMAPAAGNVYGVQNVVPGLRDHTGDATFVFEANTAEKIFAMMLAMSGKTGSNPYTSTGTLSASTPKTYTIDVASGTNTVQRYYGCQVEKITLERTENELKLKPTISALGSFQGREIASVTGASPYTINFKTDYDPSPTTGLAVGDLLRTYAASGGTTIDCTVASIVSATAITTTTNVSANVSGDFVYLRPASPSFNMLPQPALWSNTHVYFAATAAAALSASETHVEEGSTWEISYPFKDVKGEHRSGSQDPAALLRKPAEVSLTIKKYYDTPGDVENYNNMAKTACQFRHYFYSNGNVYEVRITFNNLTTDDPLPQYKAGEINYSEIKYIAKQDVIDGQAFSVTFINANPTLT